MEHAASGAVNIPIALRCERHVLFEKQGMFNLRCQHFQVVDSTQKYIRDTMRSEFFQTHSSSIPVLAVSASHQTAGRGKGNRSWFSDPHSKCLALSLAFPIPNSLVSRSALVTQLLALSTIESLDGFLPNRSAQIKWPNDIMINGKKIGGILAELEEIESGEYLLIIGIGLNIDIREGILKSGIRESGSRFWPASSIRASTGVDIDPLILRDKIIKNFLIHLEKFHVSEYIPMHLISERQFLVDQAICLRIDTNDDSSVVNGVNLGIDEQYGGIRVQHTSGLVDVYYSGEISLPRC